MSVARAQELHGFFNSAYSLTESRSSDGTKLYIENTRESLDVNWNKALSPFLSYRFTLRGERVDALSVVGQGTPVETTSTLVQPAGDITLATPGYSLNAGFRDRELFTEGNRDPSITLSERNVFTRFFYTPEALPSVSLLFDRTSSVDNRNPVTRDTDTTRLQLGSQYTIRDVSLGYTYTHQVTENHVDETTQTQDSHVGNAAYSHTFLDGRLAVNTNATLSYLQTRQDFFIPGTAKLDRPLKTGLRSGVGDDPTPLNSPPGRIVDEPALVAGTADIQLRVGVSIGFEQPVAASVGQIQVAVIPGLPLAVYQAVTFRVFTSNALDRTTWTEIGVTQVFDVVQNRYVFTFPSATARLFKVWVSVNPAGPLVRASGISAQETQAVTAGGEVLRSTSTGVVSAGITWSPIRRFTAAYNVVLNLTRQSPEEIQALSGSHTVSLTGILHRLLTATGTYQYSFNDTTQVGGQNTAATVYTFTLNSTPLPTLTSAFTLARNENRTDGKLEQESDAASLNLAAKVFPTVNLDSVAAVTKARNFTTMQDATTQALSFNLVMQVTPRISTVGNYALQIQETSPPPTGQRGTVVTNTLGGGTTYTLSRVVNFNTRFDFTTTSAGGTVLSQQYKLDWIPTSKTSMFVSYRTVEQHLLDASSNSDFISLNGRWNVSRFLDLAADYTFSHTTTSRPPSPRLAQDIHTFNVSAGFRF